LDRKQTSKRIYALRGFRKAGIRPHFQFVIGATKPAKTGGKALGLPGIHQHEKDPASLLCVIDPGVIGRLLHHGIAGLQLHPTVSSSIMSISPDKTTA
jgi:hypothetical protein